MRKWCGIDLAPLPGFNGSCDDYPRDGNHETAKDAPEHESSPPRNTTGSMRKQMMRALAAIKPGFIHIRAFMADSSAISAFSLGWSSTPAV
jgi:hypothetical protein